MIEQVISNKQGIIIVAMFLLGSSTILTTGLSAKHNLWIAVIIAISFSLLVNLIYSRLHQTYPDDNIFGILEKCYGKFIGKILALLYIWFAIYLASLVLNDIKNFISTTSLLNTPKLIIAILAILLSIWIVKEGIEVIGRWSSFTLPIMILFIIFLVLFLIPQMNLDNIKPLAYGDINTILSGSLSSFRFPFGDLIIFTMIFSVATNRISTYTVYLFGTLIGGSLILLISTMDLLVLDIDLITNLQFPTYSAAAKLNIGDFLQRLEILVAAIFIFGAFLKMSITLLAACKGISELFNYRDYKFIVVPVALLILNISQMKLIQQTLNSEALWNRTVWNSLSEFFNWSGTFFPYYTLIISVIIPIITLIISEIKCKFNN